MTRVGDDGLTTLERKAKLQRERAAAESGSRPALRDATVVLQILQNSVDEELQAYQAYEQRAEQIREMTTIPHLRKQVIERLKEIMLDEDEHFRELKKLAQLIEGATEG